MLNRKLKAILLGIALLTIGTGIIGCSAATTETALKADAGQESTADISDQESASVKEAVLEKVVKPSFTAEGIRALSVVNQGQETFAISYNPKAYKSEFDYWEISVPYEGLNCTDTEAIYKLYGILAGMDFSNEAAVAAGTDTGIEDTENIIALQFIQSDGTEDSASPDADSEAAILIGNEDGSGNYYAAVQGYEDKVYRFNKGIVDSALSINPFDYILKISTLVNIDSITDVEITVGEETHLISKEGESYKFDGKEVVKKEFTTLYQALQFIILDSELADVGEKDSESQSATDKRNPVLSIVYHRSSEEASEISVDYYELDKTGYSVETNGMERFRVPREDVDALVDTIKAAFK